MIHIFTQLEMRRHVNKLRKTWYYKLIKYFQRDILYFLKRKL